MGVVTSEIILPPSIISEDSLMRMKMINHVLWASQALDLNLSTPLGDFGQNMLDSSLQSTTSKHQLKGNLLEERFSMFSTVPETHRNLYENLCTEVALVAHDGQTVWPLQ